MTIDISFFGEDLGHESFVVPLLERVVREEEREAVLEVRSSVGGRPRLLGELQRFVDDVERGMAPGDLVVVATDCNCSAWNDWREQILERCEPLVLVAEEAVVAVTPDPHIERWMLLDSHAFSRVFGRGCDAPDLKCARERYKRSLLEAIMEASVEPTLGGMEFAADIVEHLDLDRMVTADDSLGRAISDIRRAVRSRS